MISIAPPIRWLGAALLAALLTTPAMAAPQREGDWRFCANEGDECRVQGNATVRYGTPGQWETRRIANRVPCSNQYFGDPAPGREKRCEVLGVDNGGSRGGSEGANRGWIDCADEGGVCYFSGQAQVRFGDGRNFKTRTARDSVRCDVQTFGDPAYGKVKRCQVLGKGVGQGDGSWTGGGRPPGDDEKLWAHCANEGDSCAVGKRSRVRFGVGGRYLERTVDQSITCSAEAFGRDPAPGQVKTCSWHY